MNEAVKTQPSANAAMPVEDVLRQDLARSDVLLGTIAPILGHLLASEDHALFSDEVIARVRGMIMDCARQLLLAQAEAANVDDPRSFSEEHASALAESLTTSTALVGHCHASILEWQLTERLHKRGTVEPVVSAQLQSLIASNDDSTASDGMALLAAQARFMQHMRRMEMPLIELPGDLFHIALQNLAAMDNQVGHLDEAAARLREGFDEGKSRLGIAARLVAMMGKKAVSVIDIAHSGAGLFLTALAIASNQRRELAILATNERQKSRLALSLCAAGLPMASVETQFEQIHPGAMLPDGFDHLRADAAARLLSAARTDIAG